MKLLLDTHTFLWLIVGNLNLSATAQIALADTANTLFLSVASVWELAIKTSMPNPQLTLADPLDVFVGKWMAAYQISVLPVQLPHALNVVRLPHHHRDPPPPRDHRRASRRKGVAGNRRAARGVKGGGGWRKPAQLRLLRLLLKFCGRDWPIAPPARRERVPATALRRADHRRLGRACAIRREHRVDRHGIQATLHLHRAESLELELIPRGHVRVQNPLCHLARHVAHERFP